MLLSPQHFQQWDRHLHHLIGNRFRGVQAFEWGLTRIEIDREALRNGRFVLIAASGVLPDGTPFHAPEEDPLPAARAIDAHFGAREESIVVSLGLPSSRRGHPQLGDAASPGAPGPRYSPETSELPDDNDGANERPIGVARTNLTLLFPDDALGDHDLLPVAEIERSGEGRYALREGFVPPCLWIGASERLVALIRSEHEMLLSLNATLSEKRSQRGEVADFAASDSYQFWRLLTVNSFIPVYAHFMAQRRTHPETVYLAIATLIGQLCTLSNRVSPREIPAYDHRALGGTFENLHVKFGELMGEKDPSKLVRIELHKENGLHVGRITDERVLAPNASLFLGARADMDEKTFIDDLPNKIKIASRERIDGIIAAALPGVRVDYSRNVPPSLPQRSSFLYFEVHPLGAEWEGIKGAKTVAIYLPGVPGLSLELIGLRE